MRNATLRTLFAGVCAATSLFASLALETAVLIPVSLAVVVAVEASVRVVGIGKVADGDAACGSNVAGPMGCREGLRGS